MKRYIQIGTGGFGKYWCQTIAGRISDLAVPVAAADINAQALSNAREYLRLPADKCYTNVKSALTENAADFAVIVVPPRFHEEVILLCIEHGLDIVCEKPLADTMEACARIDKAVTEAGRKLVVTMSHRFEAEKQTIEALVKSGAYGPANYAVSRLTMLRRDGRADQALREPAMLLSGGLIHNLDTLRGVFGCNARTVYADCWEFAPSENSKGSAGMAQVIFENGARAQFEASFANATELNKWSEEYLRVECAQATLIADRREVTLMSGRGFPFPQCAQIPLLNQPRFDHALIVHDFIHWLDGGPAPATCLKDNLQCCALVFAAVQSLQSGQAVDVQTFLSKYIH